MKLVFASANENKVAEIRSMLPTGLELLSLADLGVTEDIPETADTIEGNAKMKTDWLVERYNISCFSDDTGLVVPALNGEPGVRSARYAGPQRNTSDNIQLLLQNLGESGHRSAYFETVIALWWKDSMHVFTGHCHGSIATEPRGQNGFGYDPVFIPVGFDKTFAEIAPEIKNEISHRAKAFRKMKEFLFQEMTGQIL